MYENIVELIKKDIKCKEDKYIATKYYYHKQKSKHGNSVDVADIDGNIKTIKLDKTVELYTNYFKLLVNQKIDYLLSKEPTIKLSADIDIVDLVKMFKGVMLNASLHGRSWLHFYIEQSKVDWVIIKDSEIIPLYDKYNKTIISIIRYYSIGKENIKVEEWTKTGVETAIINKNKISEIDYQKHFKVETVYNNEVVETEYSNFNEIPFIEFCNDTTKESDLEDVKELIDYYNEISSGFIDNIYKFQELLIKLKGFSGQSENLDEAMKNLKRYKMVGIPHDGDMEYMSVEIPVEARKVLLELLEANIFRLGRGYNPDMLGDGNITNVVIKSRYFPLDNKCNELEKEAKSFFEKFVSFMTYRNFTNNVSNAEIEFNRNQLFNESEKLLDCINAIDLVTAGLLSKKTLVSQIPYVKDVDEELKLIAQEQKEQEQKEGQNPDKNENMGQNPDKNEESVKDE